MPARESGASVGRVLRKRKLWCSEKELMLSPASQHSILLQGSLLSVMTLRILGIMCKSSDK